MRKLILFALILSLLAFAGSAFAQQENSGTNVKSENKLHNRALFLVNQNRYFVNDQWPGQTMDAAPFIENGRTYVPVRYLAYALGVKEEDVAWDENSQTVGIKFEDKVLQLTVGSRIMKVNGQDRAMDVEPLLKNGRTFLPARWVAEALGFTVSWDPPHVLVWWGPDNRPPLTLDTLKAMYEFPLGTGKPAGPVGKTEPGGGGMDTTPAREIPMNWVE